MTLLSATLLSTSGEWLLMLATGILPAWFLLRKVPLKPFLATLLAVAACGVAGWASFWVFFLDHRLGYVFATCLLLGSCAATISASRREWKEIRHFLQNPDVYVPSLLMLFTAIAYNGILLAVSFPDLSHDQYAQVRFFSEFTPDNLLPFIFAGKLATGAPLSPLLGDWLSSDRPPLQTGIVLLLWPFVELMGNKALGYQLAGTLLQLSWIPAIWALCRSLKLSLRQTAFVIACCLFNGGFFFFNSVYVWPKLLAGSLAMLAFTLIFYCDFLSPIVAVTAGVSAGLAMLAHGGSIFGLLIIGAILPFRAAARPNARLPDVKSLLLFGSSAAASYLPWILYQKFFDPPGDRLIKYHLAGVTGIDQRSAFASIRAAYAALSPDQFWKTRVDNFWFAVHGFGDITIATDSAAAYGARYYQWQHHGAATGLLVAGLLMIPVMLARKELRKPLFAISQPLGFCILGMTLWILLMFESDATKIHHGSYLLTMTFMACLAMLLSFTPVFLQRLILIAQGALFITIWCVFALGSPNGNSLPMVGAVLLGVAGASLTLGTGLMNSGNNLNE